MSDPKEPKYKPIPIAVMVAAQQLYQQNAQAEAQRQGAGAKPAQIGLDDGWGGKGR